MSEQLLPLQGTARGCRSSRRGRVLRSGGGWIIAAISRDIRERTEAQRALHESEARFRQTFELAGSGIAHVDLDGYFLRVNRSLCAILGYSQRRAGRTHGERALPPRRPRQDRRRTRPRALGRTGIGALPEALPAQGRRAGLGRPHGRAGARTAKAGRSTRSRCSTTTPSASARRRPCAKAPRNCACSPITCPR